MQVVKTFLAGAFLGAGAFGFLTHAALVSTTQMASMIPALTVADLIETGGAVVSGVLALVVVARQDHRQTVEYR